MRFLSIFLTLLLTGCTSKLRPVSSPAPLFAKGADISWITEMESKGLRFFDYDGKEREAMALMKQLGMNTIRLRVWVNPKQGWNSTQDMISKAIRAKKMGLRIMIDFHYSDDWADPGKQFKPEAWKGLTYLELKGKLASYTTQVLTEVKKAGVLPEWVQVGNETDNGLLWPDGKAAEHMAQYAGLIDTGYVAVKAVFPASKVIAHVSNGWNNALFRWNIGGLIKHGARFDVIGMSLYPKADNWQELNRKCIDNVKDMIALYGKETMIVEVGMPWDKSEQSYAFLSDLITQAKSIANGKCSGVLYWEPQAYTNWKGYNLGAFEQSGRPTKALLAFGQ